MYTFFTCIALIASITLDVAILKTNLIRQRGYWVSYAIIFPFQLITNGWLTYRNIVQYDAQQILGVRICGAPLEDLGFGFALILAVLAIWIYRSKSDDIKG